ncbi:hypothetical protein GPECTOR_33g611 [Gonium pectorale]|uniref:O-fucosyltransferase family protein n=1 Tax=Gonium pectorale TaxID=33097 RepID=A0A150GD19_GONPE|nr:hypothetical protein GPECTOR_33g611 [Gonium pectorale]|eukprot:KXZ47729.1 hypothetical protein GPECTOR_33g611 [Gonium pectorale]
MEELPGQLGGEQGGAAWSGTLDAVLLLAAPDQPRLVEMMPSTIRAMGLKTPPPDRWLTSPVACWFGCTPDRIAQLRALIAPHRVVGVVTSHGLLYGSHWLAGPMLLSCKDACCQAYKDTALHLRMSPAIYTMADRFARGALGGQPFLAAHVRPFPDGCVRLWSRPGMLQDMDRVKRICGNWYLAERLAPSMKHLMRKYGVSRLFIMAHPKVRANVLLLFSQMGIKPVFMDFEDVAPSEGAATSAAPTANMSISLLGLVEVALCTRARAFVGTKESSMTATVIHERISQNASRDESHDSYCFFRRPAYNARPIPIKDWYRKMNYSLSGPEEWRQKQIRAGIVSWTPETVRLRIRERVGMQQKHTLPAEGDADHPADVE